MVKKTINIKQPHEDYIIEKSINLSRFVQKQLDNVMTVEKGDKRGD